MMWKRIWKKREGIKSDNKARKEKTKEEERRRSEKWRIKEYEMWSQREEVKEKDVKKEKT